MGSNDSIERGSEPDGPFAIDRWMEVGPKKGAWLAIRLMGMQRKSPREGGLNGHSNANSIS
jgi:hypothetical protein